MRLISVPPSTDASFANDAETRLAAGLQRHQAGRHDEAERLYDAVLASHPDHVTGLHLLGMLKFETGRPTEAAQLLQQVADLRPENLEARFTLASLRHWLGEGDAAAAAYRAVLAGQPDHAGALVGLAGALTQAGDPKAAVSAYLKAIRLAPGDASPRVGLALALNQLGRSAEAADAARAAVALDPDLADGWFALGAALRRGAAAIEALERALALQPGRSAAHLTLGNAYAEEGRIGDAEHSMKQAIALDPLSAEARASLGAVYLLADQPQAARACYQAAVRIDPGMIQAHQTLAALLTEAGERDQAQRHCDLAYGRQNLFVEIAAEARRRVLVLVNVGSGNVPLQHLLPKDRYTRLTWFVAYARPGQADDLPDYDVVLNAIGEPDEAGPAEAQVRAFAGVARRPLLNAPETVARTARHRIPALLAGLPDVVAPRTVRVATHALDHRGLCGAADDHGLEGPVLVRPIGSHGGKGLVLAATRDALSACRLTPGGEGYLTAFHDYQSPDGFYRKYRMIFVDRRPYPYHLAISPHWMVHHASAEMAGDPARVAEELDFLRDPPSRIGAAAMAAVEAIAARLDLDYAGLDFSVLPDGRLLVFEANATMLVHPEPPDGPFAPKNAFVRTILDAFQGMLEGR